MNYKTKDLKDSNVLIVTSMIGLIMIGAIISMATKENDVQEQAPVLETRKLVLEEDYLPESFRAEFMVSCVGEDIALFDYCACAYNYLDRNYTNTEVMKMSMDIEETGIVSDGMYDAIDACLDLYVY